MENISNVSAKNCHNGFDHSVQWHHNFLISRPRIKKENCRSMRQTKRVQKLRPHHCWHQVNREVPSHVQNFKLWLKPRRYLIWWSSARHGQSQPGSKLTALQNHRNLPDHFNPWAICSFRCPEHSFAWPCIHFLLATDIAFLERSWKITQNHRVCTVFLIVQKSTDHLGRAFPWEVPIQLTLVRIRLFLRFLLKVDGFLNRCVALLLLFLMEVKSSDVCYSTVSLLVLISSEKEIKIWNCEVWLLDVWKFNKCCVLK